jgi:hypothetical protein
MDHLIIINFAELQSQNYLPHFSTGACKNWKPKTGLKNRIKEAQGSGPDLPGIPQTHCCSTEVICSIIRMQLVSRGLLILDEGLGRARGPSLNTKALRGVPLQWPLLCKIFGLGSSPSSEQIACQ